ncbi:MAG: glycosyltransferase [Rhodoferax sp.]|nr:glycosyltransferase [Rhodoferax sp.]
MAASPPDLRFSKLARGGEALPIYTVMVALYREAAVVPQLIAALDALDWPRSLLDVKLVCEGDDQETLEAIRQARPGPHIEVVEVPAMAPRTKPKALTYALSGARGEFLTIYDAEDRPHPQQLREAYHAFRLGPADLACLQSPLVIDNAGESWISAIFALEYSALFRRLLPALGFYRLPLPLGGTSNHFKTALLKESGGWDPYNVTEDADLGMRLCRMGYRSSTLTLPTYEDAPTDFGVWLAQRTRWYKGWLQTWLVLMRHPLRTAREMGPLSFFVFQLLVGGVLVAALSHPGLIVFITLFCPVADADPGRPAECLHHDDAGHGHLQHPRQLCRLFRARRHPDERGREKGDGVEMGDDPGLLDGRVAGRVESGGRTQAQALPLEQDAAPAETQRILALGMVQANQERSPRRHILVREVVIAGDRIGDDLGACGRAVARQDLALAGCRVVRSGQHPDARAREIGFRRITPEPAPASEAWPRERCPDAA